MGKWNDTDFYICIFHHKKWYNMLNIGIIGNTEVLEPFVKRIQKNVNVNVIGKASVGTSVQLNSFHFSIPEFNKVELIERADVVLIDGSSLFPFKLLCDIVKKAKHIFTAEYLNLSIGECEQLIKLSNESGSIVQVSNPFFYSPAIQWMNTNLRKPLFLDISKFTTEVIKGETFYPMLLMLLHITGVSPKRIGAVTFESVADNLNFSNVRLEFGDASVVNLNFGNLALVDKFIIKSYSNNQFIMLDFTNQTFECNNKPIDISEYNTVNEFDSFIDTIRYKTKKTSSLENYLIAMDVVQQINKKFTQFFVQ